MTHFFFFFSFLSRVNFQFLTLVDICVCFSFLSQIWLLCIYSEQKILLALIFLSFLAFIDSFEFFTVIPSGLHPPCVMCKISNLTAHSVFQIIKKKAKNTLDSMDYNTCCYSFANVKMYHLFQILLSPFDRI